MSNKSQITNYQPAGGANPREAALLLGFWKLELIWNLDFEYWDLSFHCSSVAKGLRK
jgi:hypothetical protein